MSSTKLRDNALDLIGKAIKKDHKKATTKEKTEKKKRVCVVCVCVCVFLFKCQLYVFS